MGTSSFPSTVFVSQISKNLPRTGITANPNPNFTNLIRTNRPKISVGTRKLQAIGEAATSADLGQVEVTWEIAVGALAGVTPFVVAGIEFSKRIVAQRRCSVCKGSGLVRREKYYFRCPRCGGFLPWQSWKRFFSEVNVTPAISSLSGQNIYDFPFVPVNSSREWY